MQHVLDHAVHITTPLMENFLINKNHTKNISNNMGGFRKTHQGKSKQYLKNCPMIGGYSTCMEMSGNGAWTVQA